MMPMYGNGTGNGAGMVELIDRLELPQRISDTASKCQVCVVGAGPAGLMLACNLARFGVHLLIIDNRADQTPAGRADGLQPKSIETFRQMRLADPLLQRGVRVYDISFWASSLDEPLSRLGREVHYPAIVDVLDRYLLLVHQGIVENVFIEDMKKRGVEVQRNTAFCSYSVSDDNKDILQIDCNTNVNPKTILAEYLVGCDGVHSAVRRRIEGAHVSGLVRSEMWAVLDGELVTDFPDIWSKSLVCSREHGNLVVIPRERNMTRLYVELKSGPLSDERQLSQEFAMNRAKKIIAPFTLEWKSIEWSGRYQIGQRVADKFCDHHLRTFLAGDASHMHSPKSAQGMNTSMHDAWNLAWKLNLAVRGLAKPVLLESYEDERRKVALDMAHFDLEEANHMADGDAEAMADNFKTSSRLLAGVGADYDANAINVGDGIERIAGLRPGSLLLPAKVTRYLDSNPVDIQLDIPMLGQFRIYILSWKLENAADFLDTFCRSVASEDSLLSSLSAAARLSYQNQPRLPAREDIYLRPERYTAVSHLFTFALITSTPKSSYELSDLPPLLQDSRWTIYMDDYPPQDEGGMLCITKWLETLQEHEVAIVNVRPDGYVGSIKVWDLIDPDAGLDAAEWLNSYYGGFLQVPEVSLKVEDD